MILTHRASESLRETYNSLCDERNELFSTLNDRILAGGDKMNDDERSRMDVLNSRIDEAKKDYEAQRDLENIVAGADTIGPLDDPVTSYRQVSDIAEASYERSEGARKVVRDAFGSEGLRAFDERSGQVMADFAHMSDNGKGSSRKITLNHQAARNFKLLDEMGVSPQDWAHALRSGKSLIAARTDEGKFDVRAYNVGTSGEGQQLVPTFWDNSLYLFASYVGGVQVAGAEVIPVNGTNTLKLPSVTAYSSGVDIVAESTTMGSGQEVKDTTGTVDLSPRAYRGWSAETDEIIRSASIDVRMLLVLRGLARALQLGKEDDFHDGDGSSKPKGILNGVAAARITKTGGATTALRYQDVPHALALLDAEYHASSRGDSLVSLMNSRVFWEQIVALKDSNGQPVYPPSLAMGGGRQLFTTRVEFSHKMASTAAADKLLVCTGNFRDGYVIASTGTAEIEVSDDVNFMKFERVYRIQEYCDGKVRDAKALAYVQSKA